jgi:glycyl-tRNA synthetase beta chain
MAQYLLEIGIEEMPANIIPNTVKELKDDAAKLFKENRLDCQGIRTYATPRRLVLCIDEVPDKQEDLSEEVKGPAVKAAYKDGAAAKPLLGFLRSNGFTEADVYTKTLKNGDYVFCRRDEVGKPAAQVLSELMPQLILSLKFPNAMRWGAYKLQYIRPIRWIVSLLDDEVVPFGVGHLEAGRTSRGHRTLGHESVTISSAGAYFETMEKEFVIVDQDKRRQMILDQISNIFEGTDEHYKEDESLLSEVINIVEFPTVLKGYFDEEFLNLPKELVITPMKDHQRYFPVLNSKGELVNAFITVRNGNAEYLEVVQHGNENVLRARLADAKFFYDEDIKNGISAGEEKLKDIVFQEKLGTLYDKIQRLQKEAGQIGMFFGLDDAIVSHGVTAAKYAKCDLSSNAVTEFPELQGIMGEYYYDHEFGTADHVGQAIRESYLPRYANDGLPQTKEGSLVSVSDKLDTIVGCYYAGIIPTGSQDPYALRRQALGIVNIIIDNQWSASLKEMINAVRTAYVSMGNAFNDPKVDQQIYEFFEPRILKVLKDEKIPQDIIQAVIQAGIDDIYETYCRALALRDFIDKEDETLVKKTFDNHKRADTISEKATEGQVHEELFVTNYERDFYKALQTADGTLKEAGERKDFYALLLTFASLNEVVEAFFTETLIMDENEAVRNNRLSLVKMYANVLNKYYRLSLCTIA